MLWEHNLFVRFGGRHKGTITNPGSSGTLMLWAQAYSSGTLILWAQAYKV